ncbi:HD domain-containing protein [Lachnospiraceae bacterium OM04-12BH]|jgi:HD domain-containing protein|nr:HD domain-containing protein [Lachnospiraceae bacterium OM04-12BH]
MGNRSDRRRAALESLKEGHQRRMEKYRKQYEQRRKFYRLLKENASDILHSENFQKTRHHIQHGTMPVYRHCLDVAKQSIQINKALGLGCSERDLIRGALLHDYFLYDWHDKNRENYQKLHGFYHPGIALKNARKEYHLTRREEDIIKKHMWPLTVVPPLCREAWVVTAADKYCSLLETLKIRKRPGRVRVGVAK